jgi:hypothetical protein
MSDLSQELENGGDDYDEEENNPFCHSLVLLQYEIGLAKNFENKVNAICPPTSHCLFLYFCLHQLLPNKDIINTIVRFVHEVNQNKKIRMCLEHELDELGSLTRLFVVL